ncbi:MAG: hypothetical protein BWY59_00696 [Verrucomicrobia bacterium ADurb.Bin345]|nr:MAG: hypothetical protein BWY59_00696 [Verrucomicrobia bacterium ADurb.Bin345]
MVAALLAQPPTRDHLVPNEALPPHERAGCNHHDLGLDGFTARSRYPPELATLNPDARRFGLHQLQPGRAVHHDRHSIRICRLVALGPTRLNRRSLARVQGAKVYPCVVCVSRHLSAKCVQLENNVGLGHASNGWIARHPGNGSAIKGNKGGLCTHPGGRQGRLTTGVAGPDHKDIIRAHLRSTSRCKILKIRRLEALRHRLVP